MLAAFAVLAILLVALDASAGVPLHSSAPPVSAPPAEPAQPVQSTVATPAAPPLPSAPTVSASAVAADATRPSTPRPAQLTAITAPSPTVTFAAVSATATGTALGTVTDAPGTPTARRAATGSATLTTTGTATVVATASVTGTPGLAGATPAPVTAPDTSPPHYGLFYAYANNTAFTPDYLHVLSTRIIALTNEQRANDNLAPLTENERLDIIAAARSEDMVRRHYFDHYDPSGPLDGSGRHAAAVVELLARNSIPYAEVGENLIDRSGYALDDGTPRQVITAWMNHSEHRDNILRGSYTKVGVGIATDLGPDGLRVVVTQVFLH